MIRSSILCAAETKSRARRKALLGDLGARLAALAAERRQVEDANRNIEFLRRLGANDENCALGEGIAGPACLRKRVRSANFSAWCERAAAECAKRSASAAAAVIHRERETAAALERFRAERRREECVRNLCRAQRRLAAAVREIRHEEESRGD